MDGKGKFREKLSQPQIDSWLNISTQVEEHANLKAFLRSRPSNWGSLDFSTQEFWEGILSRGQKYRGRPREHIKEILQWIFNFGDHLSLLGWTEALQDRMKNFIDQNVDIVENSSSSSSSSSDSTDSSSSSSSESEAEDKPKGLEDLDTFGQRVQQHMEDAMMAGKLLSSQKKDEEEKQSDLVRAEEEKKRESILGEKKLNDDKKLAETQKNGDMEKQRGGTKCLEMSIKGDLPSPPEAPAPKIKKMPRIQKISDKVSEGKSEAEIAVEKIQDVMKEPANKSKIC